MNRAFGSLVGGVFGLVYVVANAGALPGPAATALRLGAVAAFIALLVLLRRARSSRPARPAGGHGRAGFGRGYWLVVLGEVVAIVAGSAVVRAVLDPPEAVVAWVSVVVGVHFVALAVVWRESVFHGLGAAIALCGAAGLVAAAAGASGGVIATLGGVLPGVLLLGAGLLGAVGAGRGG